MSSQEWFSTRPHYDTRSIKLSVSIMLWSALRMPHLRFGREAHWSTLRPRSNRCVQLLKVLKEAFVAPITSMIPRRSSNLKCASNGEDEDSWGYVFWFCNKITVPVASTRIDYKAIDFSCFGSCVYLMWLSLLNDLIRRASGERQTCRHDSLAGV